MRGATATYSVVLTSEPTADVTVTPVSGNTAAVTVSDALTFTADNWDTTQMVTVTGVADADTDDETVTISHTVAGGDYGSVTVADVTVTVTDIPPVADASIWSGTLTVKQLSDSLRGCSNQEATMANQCVRPLSTMMILCWTV